MTPQWIQESGYFVLRGWSGVSAWVSTRQTGLPSASYAIDDLRRIVEKKEGELEQVIGMEQVHGGDVRAIMQASSDLIVPGVDGLTTGLTGVALTMRSADCLPVFIYDPKNQWIGLAHAGWRGIRAGVISHLVQAMKVAGVNPKNCLAALGPAIGPCCYEVGAELESWAGRWLKRAGGKLYFDLPKAALEQLSKAGFPQDIPGPAACTACHLHICHSFRREAAGAGRLLSSIALQ